MEAKLNFESYKGNELEMGLKWPIMEAERDESLSQYLQYCGQKTSLFSFRLEASGYFQ